MYRAIAKTLFVFLFIMAPGPGRAADHCVDLMNPALSERSPLKEAQKFQTSQVTQTSGQTKVFGFNQDPNVQNLVSMVVSESSIRAKPVVQKHFNGQLAIKKAKSLDKVIREETPLEVLKMGDLLIDKVNDFTKFKELGWIVGDPHNGNVDVVANVFSVRSIEKNIYTVNDLDESTIGVFSADFARFIIELKAAYGDLDRTFGAGTQDEIFRQYVAGLNLRAMVPPSFVIKVTRATPGEIRAKFSKYAQARTDDSGKFKAKLFEQKILRPFKTKFMEPKFLQALGFDRKTDDRKAFKANLLSALEKSLRSDFAGSVKILDIAVEPRDTGGSAFEQRFMVSTEIVFKGQIYRLLVEFKENQKLAGWSDVVEAPFKNAAERYAFSLNATLPDTGPFLHIADLTATSFEMRPKGGMGIETSGTAELLAQTLFNANHYGLIHGGQGSTVSGPYVQEVNTDFAGFKSQILALVQDINQEMEKVSGQDAPAYKKLGH